MACPGRPAVSRPSSTTKMGGFVLTHRARACRALLLGSLLLAGCARERQAAPAALMVVDDAGDTVRLAAPARRIASLIPATTELLFALGLGERVVGRTTWCDYPAAALAVPSLGDGLQPNLEAILAARPDLVVLYRSTQNEAAAAQLRSQGIATLVLSTDRLEDVPRTGRLLATLAGDPAAGERLAVEFEAALREATRPMGTQPPTVLLLAWDQPPIAIGAGSFLSELVSRAGATNLFGDLAAPSAPVSLEAIVHRNPQFVLVLGDSAPGFSRRTEWQAVPAVAAQRFLRVPQSLFSRPGPRSPAALRALEAALDSADAS